MTDAFWRFLSEKWSYRISENILKNDRKMDNIIQTMQSDIPDDVLDDDYEYFDMDD